MDHCSNCGRGPVIPASLAWRDAEGKPWSACQECWPLERRRRQLLGDDRIVGVVVELLTIQARVHAEAGRLPCVQCKGRAAPEVVVKGPQLCIGCYEEKLADQRRRLEAQRRAQEEIWRRQAAERRRLEEAERRQASVALDQAKKALNAGLVKTRAEPSGPPGQVVEGLKDELVEDLWVRWFDQAEEAIGNLVEADGLHVDVEPYSERLDVRFTFLELRRKPVPLMITHAVARLTAAVKVEGEEKWRIWTTVNGKRWYREQPAEELGYLREPVSVSRELGRITFPLAVLDALARPEHQAPGADLVAVGVEGAAWECDGREYRLPPWAVLVFRGRPVPESLAGLGIPDSLHPAALAALRRPAESPAALPAADTVPPAVQEEGVRRLHSLDAVRFPIKRARDLVDATCRDLPGDVAVDDIVRAVLSS